MNIQYHLLITTFLSFSYGSTNPCITAPYLPYQSLRITNYSPDVIGGEKYICDKEIIPIGGHWYRVGDNDLMGNKTEPFSCGTQNPIWTNESLPTKQDEVFDIKACVPGIHSACQNSLPIKVKNCGLYRVYFLVPPAICPAAYCFGYGDNVPAPNITVDRPTVVPDVARKINGFIDTEQLKFVCEFPPLPDKEKYYYQVFWYFDGQLKFRTKPEEFQDLSKTDLVEEHHTDLKLIDTNIVCGVRLRLARKGPAGKLSPLSSQFYAGIKVKSTTYSLVRGEELSISMQPTIPFGCPFVNKQRNDIRPCDLRIEMFAPMKTNQCHGSFAATNVDNCGLTIPKKQKDDWKKEHFFIISWKDKNIYKFEAGHYIVKFRVQRNINHELWNHHYLPDINIHLVEQNTAWKGTSCYAHSDPHMRTFDKRTYDNHLDGTFIMYQNVGKYGSTIMQVQIKVTSCNGYGPRCVCGTAIRAGGDVYMVDRCPDRKKHVFRFQSCRDNSVLDVRKVNENKYKIYFPTGTYVLLNLYHYTGKYVMNVDIFPSVRDFRKTKGLCGNFNGNPHDEFNSPDGTKNGFNKHWRVSDTDNLFSMNKSGFAALARWNTSMSFCTCPSNTSAPVSDITCTSSMSVTCNRIDHHVLTNCRVLEKRKRRSISSFTPDNYIYSEEERHLRMKRATASGESTVMTPTAARQYCENYMKQSSSYNACSKVPNIDPSESIDTCMLDIQLTNSTEWSAVSRESLKSTCLKEISVNTTLQETSGNETSIADLITTLYCPNECSGHGLCNNGSCECKNGFGAADCSMDLNEPPIVYGVNIDDGGLCETNECDTVFVEGDFFINTPNISCSLEYFEIPYQGNLTLSDVVSITPAKHNTIAEVICPLSHVRKRREIQNDLSFVHGYVLSVSNNGRQFSSKHKLYILDSRCQDTANISGELVFVLKEGFCFIRGNCILEGTEDGNNPCRVCKPGGQVLDWSWKDDENCRNEKEKSKLWVIGVVLGVVAIVLVALGFYLLKRKIKRTNRINRESPFPEENPPPYK